MSRILVVDDEVKLLRLISALFEEEGWSVDTATRAEAASEQLSRSVYDLLVTDVRLPQRSGIDLLRDALAAQPDLPVIVITAYGTVTEAVEAMRLGATDYLLKPFEMEGLLHIASKALESGRLRRDYAELRAQTSTARPGHELVAKSAAMAEVLRQVDRVAAVDTTVLLLGESGVGKELVAQTIHDRSLRRDRPLVRVNCPAIPRDLLESELFGHVRGAFTGASTPRKGKFEVSDGGTLFLDELGDLPLEQQGKLLHVLERQCFSRVGSSEEIPVDVRILAATNRDLDDLVAAGRFRADLYHRLHVFPVKIAPLRERPDDLEGLIEQLLVRLALRLGHATPLRIAPAVIDVLREYRWPGNIRELRNILERAAVLAGAGEITSEHLPREICTRVPGPRCGDVVTGNLNDAVEQFKVHMITDALERNGWRKKAAAAELGLSPRAISYYVQRHGLGP